MGLGQLQNYCPGLTMLSVGHTSTSVEGGKGHPVKETQQARLHSSEGLPSD